MRSLLCHLRNTQSRSRSREREREREREKDRETEMTNLSIITIIIVPVQRKRLSHVFQATLQYLEIPNRHLLNTRTRSF